jgi:predicted Zn-dependent protease with MMP-like domain
MHRTDIIIERDFAVERARFEQLVWQAVQSLPVFFQERLQNVMIVIQDRPDPELIEEPDSGALLGLYQGVPLTERSVFAERSEPDIIYIFQKNIEALANGDEDEIRRQVRITVIHEIGHHFGLDEDQLAILEDEPDVSPPSTL